MSRPPQTPTPPAAAVSVSAVGSSSDLPVSFPSFDAPPQASYGWFVDVPPPRGPFFWPCQPEAYRIAARRDAATGVKREAKGQAAPSSAHSTPPPVPLGSGESDSGASSAASSLLSTPPQLSWGWFCAVPPPSAPFFWPALPEGYVLVRADEVETITLATHTTATTDFGSTQAAAFAPTRQASHVTAHPLAAQSTLPPPHAIATPAPLPSLPLAPLGMSSPFTMPFAAPRLGAMGSPPPTAMHSATAAPTAQAPTDDVAMTDNEAQAAPAPAVTKSPAKRGKARR